MKAVIVFSLLHFRTIGETHYCPVKMVSLRGKRGVHDLNSRSDKIAGCTPASSFSINSCVRFTIIFFVGS